MDPDDINTKEVQIRHDIKAGYVEVKSSGEWNQMSPDDAEELADGYEKAVEAGKIPGTAQTTQFVNILRQYADRVRDGE